jgi:hypothetical protein
MARLILAGTRCRWNERVSKAKASTLAAAWRSKTAFRVGALWACHPAGLTAIEVLTVLAVIVAIALILLMAIPRAREQSRLAGCSRNLGQIGVALALYDQFQNHLPTVSQLATLDDRPTAPGLAPPSAPGPLRTLLETLVLPDFTELVDRQSPPKPRPGEVPGETFVRGFVCQSDPNALAGRFRAPVSYRAAAGDTPVGDNGPFAPGHVFTLAKIEAGDGLSYTAGFSERLVGDKQNGVAGLSAYHVVAAPLSPGASDCPSSPDAPDSGWRGDAGSSWRACDYRSTVYNHSLRPMGQPSCISRDGQTALMGASSGHTRGINLLLLDGRVTLVVPSIEQNVWRELGRLGREDAE